MKKIATIAAAAALVSGLAFAGEPVSNPAVVDFTGNASVSWGVDLESGNTGFRNSEEAKIKLQIIDNGDKTTSSDKDVWAELKIKADDVSATEVTNSTADADTVVKMHKPAVDTAKFHFGDLFFIGIKSGDTEVGQLKVTRAIHSGDNDNGIVLPNVGAPDYTQGIVAGVTSDVIDVNVDVRSLNNAANQYTNEYAVAADATLKVVENLKINGGFSYQITEDGTIGYSASAEYKIALGDTYYVQPAAGYVGQKNGDVSEVAAAVIFGWGDTADDNCGVYYLNSDDEKKVTPGVSVSYIKDLKNENDLGAIEAAFFSGSLVENLKAAALAEIGLGKVLDETEAIMQIRAAAAYDIKADDVTITPKAGFKLLNDNASFVLGGSGDTELEVSAGVDVTGLINNTTFSAEWVSGELLQAENMGTFNLTAKISF